jgi:hypothetical protein
MWTRDTQDKDTQDTERDKPRDTKDRKHKRTRDTNDTRHAGLETHKIGNIKDTQIQEHETQITRDINDMRHTDLIPKSRKLPIYLENGSIYA